MYPFISITLYIVYNTSCFLIKHGLNVSNPTQITLITYLELPADGIHIF